MNIEFNIFKLKPESDTYKRWSSMECMEKDIDSELIIVGEEKLSNKNFIKVVPVNDGQICMIGGLKINEAAYYVPEEDLYRPTDETVNLKLEDVAEANIKKLKQRYPEGFSVEASKNRKE